jgi:hypothetical protein
MKQIICPWVGGERFTPEDQYQHLETKKLSKFLRITIILQRALTMNSKEENSVMELQNSAWCSLELGACCINFQIHSQKGNKIKKLRVSWIRKKTN